MVRHHEPAWCACTLSLSVLTFVRCFKSDWVIAVCARSGDSYVTIFFDMSNFKAVCNKKHADTQVPEKEATLLPSKKTRQCKMYNMVSRTSFRNGKTNRIAHHPVTA